jgi:hypothetical protein
MNELYRVIFEAFRPRLEEAGFINGMYGDVPFTIEWPDDAGGFADGMYAANIVADKRIIGNLSMRHKGMDFEYSVTLNVGGWVRGDGSQVAFTVWEQVGMQIHNASGVARLNVKGSLSDAEIKTIESIMPDEEAV